MKADKKTLRLRRFDKVRREAENLGKQEEQKEKFAAIADGSITVGKRDNGSSRRSPRAKTELERTQTDLNGQNTAPTDAEDDIWDDDEMSDVPFQEAASGTQAYYDIPFGKSVDQVISG
ncbi:MAG: hypothetical protein MJ016_08875, partial [Victivallaceae bacterium]|nr:hypothetical protein [Victivallaceae bacterium]